MSIQVLLVEHDDVERLYPFAETHCSWELRTGINTILERWTATLPADVTVTVESHRDLHVRSFVERHPGTPPFRSAPTLIMGGHVLLAPSVMHQLVELAAASTEPFLVGCSGHTVGAFLPTPLSAPMDAVELLGAMRTENLPIVECSGHVVNRLWQAIDHVGLGIAWDAELSPVHIADTARVHPTAVIDVSSGPVLLGENVTVGPLAVLRGPIALADGCMVAPHAILHAVAAGTRTKLGGEVDTVIVQSHSNKQHFGFLGHSYLGSWVNLGAGTTCSNLKNTYGHVRAQTPWGEEDTQRQFFGVCIGDHSKSAIGTLFATGCLVGVSANVVTTGITGRSIPSYAWKDARYDVDKAVDVARTVMARRDIDLGPETEALLRYLAG